MSLFLVVPCYNEAMRLDKEAFFRALEEHADLHLLFVDDGSTDDTHAHLAGSGAKFGDRWRVLKLDRNCGKAEAVRQGILSVPDTFNYFGYWDADLSNPLSEIGELLARIKTGKRMVIASRWKRLGAEVKRNELRHYFGRVFATMASIILKLPVYDTQCGAKIFSAAMRELFEEPFTSRWLFDVEILARFRNKFGRDAALRDIVEYPVGSWIEKGDSRVKASYIFKMPFEMWRIAQRYNRLRQDDRQA